MYAQPCDPPACLETGEGELVQHDRRKADEGDLERVAVEDCYAAKRYAKQHELQRNAKQGADRAEQDHSSEKDSLVENQTSDVRSHKPAP